MKDRLEEFVSENREAFDVFEPRPELWQEICQELPKAKKETTKVIKFNFGDSFSFSGDLVFMRVAATIVLLLGCALTLILTKQNGPSTTNTLAAATEAPLNRIAPEMVEVEAYYTSQIEARKSQLSEYDLKALGLDKDQEIDQELERLNNSYLQLKKELYTTPNTDKVMDAMIQNLQLRIRVLNRQLEILQKVEQLQQQQPSEPQKDETSHV
jgi:hypothetical protein